MQSLLCRLAKKCKFTLHLKQTIRIWWDNAQKRLPEEEDEGRCKNRAKLLAELDRNRDLPNWLQNIPQRASRYGHVLANTQFLPKTPRRGRTHHGETAYTMVALRRTLLQRQDLIRMDSDNFLEEG